MGFTSNAGGGYMGGPEKQPEQKEIALSNEEITQYLVEHFDVAFLEPQLKVIVEEASEDQKKDLERWIAALDARTGKWGLAAQLPPQNILWIRKSFHEFLDIRRQVLKVILEGIRKQRIDINEKADYSAFVEDVGSGISIEEQIEEIEELLDQDPPNPLEGGGERNELYYKNNPYLPKFNKIEDMAAIIDHVLLHGIDPEETAEARAATELRLLKLKAQLAVIERMDPIGSATYQVIKQHRGGPMNKLGRLAMIAAGTAMAIIAIIPVLQKLWNKQDLTLVDMALPAAWTALAMAGLGYNPFKRKTQLKQVILAAGSVKYDKSFQSLMDKMGRRKAIAAAGDLNFLLAEDEKEEMLKKELIAKQGVSVDFIRKLTDEPEKADDQRSELFIALAENPNLTDGDRHRFLSKLYSLHIEKEGNLQAILTAMRDPKRYAITSLNPSPPSLPTLTPSS